MLIEYFVKNCQNEKKKEKANHQFFSNSPEFF